MTAPDLPASRLDAIQHTFSGNKPYFISLNLVFSAPFDPGRMQTALNLLTAALPVLTAHFHENAPGWTYTGNPVELTPFSGNTSDAVTYANTDPAGSAPFLVLASPDRKTLILTIDHAITDAHGLIRIAGLLGTAYRTLKTDPAYTIPAPGQTRNIPLTDRIPGHTETEYRRLCEREIAASQTAKPWHTHLACHTPDNGAYQFRIKKIQPDELTRAKTAAKHLGATVNDLLKTAFARALQDCIAEKTGERIPCIPLRQANDLRKYLPETIQQEIGNFSVPCWASVEYPPDEEFPAALRRTGETSRQLKNSPTAPGIVFAVEHPDLPVSQNLLTSEQISAASLSNIGIISPESLSFGDDLPLEDALPYADLRFGNPYYLIASTYNGRLSLVIVTRTAGSADAERILDKVTRIIRTFARTEHPRT